MTSDRLRVAFIGCGGIAGAHLAGIHRFAPRLDVTAVVDVDRARREVMGERAGARPFESLEAVLEAGVADAVDIMLPHDLHEEAAVAALDAGVHVLLEKPLAADLAAAERILAAGERAAERDVVLMVAEQAQYWPDVLEARRRIESGDIGEVLFGRACYFDHSVLPPAADLEVADEPPWRFLLDRAGGGLAVDGGAHWIRPLRMLLGEVDEVIAVTGRHVDAMEGESWYQALLRFRGGTTATFEGFASNAAIAPFELFRITGTEGELVLTEFGDARLTLYNRAYPEGTVVLDEPRGRAAGYGRELADFAAVVLDGAAPAAPASAALGELRTALAMYRSVTSGRWESVWS